MNSDIEEDTPRLDIEGPNCYNDQNGPYMKIGMQNWNYSSMPEWTEPLVIYYDNWRMDDQDGVLSSLDPGTRKEAATGSSHEEIYVSVPENISIKALRRSVKISFQISEPSWVVIKAYSPHGELITMVSDGYFLPGSHAQVWNPGNALGEMSVNGVYFISVDIGYSKKVYKLIFF
jgi:hypothetical protein